MLQLPSEVACCPIQLPSFLGLISDSLCSLPLLISSYHTNSTILGKRKRLKKLFSMMTVTLHVLSNPVGRKYAKMVSVFVLSLMKALFSISAFDSFSVMVFYF